MLACNSFIEILIRFQKDIEVDDIKKFRKYLIRFKANSEKFIDFVEENKTIKGFEDINYKELNPFEKDEMLTVIDRILRDALKEERNQSHSHLAYIE